MARFMLSTIVVAIAARRFALRQKAIRSRFGVPIMDGHSRITVTLKQSQCLEAMGTRSISPIRRLACDDSNMWKIIAGLSLPVLQKKCRRSKTGWVQLGTALMISLTVRLPARFCSMLASIAMCFVETGSFNSKIRSICIMSRSAMNRL